jgi:hypothetical protein
LSDLEAVGSDLRETVTKAQPLLSQLQEPAVSARPHPGKWSNKEILGHLLDSASNNHQRFVRAALEGNLVFPGYDQDRLVQLERFQALEWKFLVEFWANYNCFLSQIISALPPHASTVRCTIGENRPATLEWLAQDYVAHLKHHLNQILGETFATPYRAEAS